jgi:hypothetical protein
METYTKLHTSTIECKEGLCISRLVKFELLLELKIEQKQGTSLHTSSYKHTTSFKRSVPEQYRLSVPVFYLGYRTASTRTSPSILNRIPVMAPISAPILGVHFFQGHFSLKNGTICPLSSHDSSSFKDTCLLYT